MASSWHPAAAPSQVCAPDDVSAARVEGRSASGGSAVPDGAGAWLGQLGAAAGTRERAWGPAPTNQGPVFVGPRPGEAALELPLPPELAAELAARGVPLQGAGALAPPPALVAEFGRLQVHGAGPVPAHGQAAQMHLPNLLRVERSSTWSQACVLWPGAVHTGQRTLRATHHFTARRILPRTGVM